MDGEKLTPADRLALNAWRTVLFYLAPAALLAFAVGVVGSQELRESAFGPDYVTRSTPSHHGQSPWWGRYLPWR